MTSSSKSSKSSNNEKTCCILIGSSGCGKSTLVENMSSDGMNRSGDSSTSVTTGIEIINHKSSNLLLMDTIGCEDTGGEKTDDQILKEITHKLAESNAPKIKVIWCTKPEDRSIPKLKKQAGFINALVNGNWGAVQLVVKKGLESSDSNGVRGCIESYTNINLPVFNLHCLDRIKNFKTNIVYKYAWKGDKKEREEDGMLFTYEINDVISSKINKLKSAKANLEKEFYHKDDGKLKTKMKHTGRIIVEWYHPGYDREYVSSSRRTCPYGHSEDDIEYCVYKRGSWVSYWECDECGKNIKVGHNFYHCFGCCNRGKRSGHSSIVKKCAGMYCTDCGKETRETKSRSMSCCGNSSSSSGCTVRERRWSCCRRREFDEGKVVDYKYWSCCGTKEKEKLNSVCGEWKWVPKNLKS